MNGNDYGMNYVTANRFYVEIDSTIRASFTECSGLGVSIEKDTYLEGGMNNKQYILMKAAKFSDVTLKRGITDDLEFWKWINQVLDGTRKRYDVGIILFNQAGERMQTWRLIQAIPVGWKAPSLQASANNVAIEELSLAYERLDVK
ncbi:phage tail protein [Anabaena sp. FACHB-1237]|uniref:phage tail protein n=1 Tax=Anabaena sp. FACHB-1237 TaxID=2692769 RepID=UPI0016816A22|nr:phage tail protein [Anabaena sp. FACHB-1237]MBD2137771.1 phage tail protein [Anabaena sp. FACHB-1237]